MNMTLMKVTHPTTEEPVSSTDKCDTDPSGLDQGGPNPGDMIDNQNGSRKNQAHPSRTENTDSTYPICTDPCDTDPGGSDPSDMLAHPNGSCMNRAEPWCTENPNSTYPVRTDPCDMDPNGLDPGDMVAHLNSSRMNRAQPCCIENSDSTFPICTDPCDMDPGGSDPGDMVAHLNDSHMNGSRVNVKHAYHLFLQKQMKESNFTIANALAMKKRVSSQLVIESNTQFFCLETSPLEIYLASHLRRYYHWCTTKNLSTGVTSAGPVIKNSVVTYIPADVDYYVDKVADTLSVVRAVSSVFQQHNLSPDIFQVLLFCADHGEISRCHDKSYSHVIDFGIKAEVQSTNHKALLYGHKYFNRVENPLQEIICQSIGNIVDFI